MNVLNKESIECIRLDKQLLQNEEVGFSKRDYVFQRNLKNMYLEHQGPLGNRVYVHYIK